MTFDISVLLQVFSQASEVLTKMGEILAYMQGLSLSDLITFVNSAPFQALLEALRAVPLT